MILEPERHSRRTPTSARMSGEHSIAALVPLAPAGTSQGSLGLSGPVGAQRILEVLDADLTVKLVDHVRAGAGVTCQHKNIDPGP